MQEETIGIIGGTGLGDALQDKLTDVDFRKVKTPFGDPSTEVMVGRFGERQIAFLNRHGLGHKLSPSEVPYAANIFALKDLGVRTLIASGAVGSLREEIAPGHLVIVDQFIDKTFKRRSTFFADYGAVHCELSEPTCPRLRRALIDAADKTDAQTHPSGTYVCMEGPQFSTKAESLMHRTWGGDLIGMTAMPEAKLAREAQMCYALVALATDYDCWKEHEPGKDKQTLLAEIIGNLKTATDNCLALLEAFLASDTISLAVDCPCRHTLELAVWTDPTRIDSTHKGRLAVLFE